MENKGDIFFSVLVAAYNVEGYLHDCVQSVMASVEGLGGVVACEVVIVDDGSTDNTGHIADEWASKYPCVRVIHQNNRGLSCVRNVGIMNAWGKYCVFVDGDDLLKVHALKTIYQTITNYSLSLSLLLA